ncbi:hypothetical protein HID58_085052, partial [Brassica napus]
MTVGNEVISVAVDALRLAGSLEGSVSGMPSMRIGGVALDLVGIPLSEETLTKAKNSDDVFLGAVGWPKWDNNSKHLKLNGAVAASYGSRSISHRHIIVLGMAYGMCSALHLVDLTYYHPRAYRRLRLSWLKMSIYNAHPRGFTTNEQGDEVGLCTETYSASEFLLLLRDAALLLLPHPLNRLLRFHAPPSDKVKIDAAIESVRSESGEPDLGSSDPQKPVNFVSIMFLSRQSGGKVELQRNYFVYIFKTGHVLSLGQIENEHISCTSRKDEEEDENDKVSGGKEL